MGSNVGIGFRTFIPTMLLLLAIMTFPIPTAHSTTSTVLYFDPGLSYSLLEQTVMVNVSVADAVNLNAWETSISFDPNVLNCTQAWVPADSIFGNRSLLQSPDPQIDNTAGSVLYYRSLDFAAEVNGSGTLFQLEFRSKVMDTSALNFVNKYSLQGTRLLNASSPMSMPFETVEGSVEVIYSKKYLSVPFHYQNEIYYSGPAALEMMFDLYGEDIPQQEIAEAARTHPNVTYPDELRRAAHFSNMSTSMGQELPQNITGYSARKLGYGAFEREGLSLAQLQAAVYEGYPIIVSTWYNLSQQRSHYRVVVGYNATHIRLHDPWNKMAWGGAYGGPNQEIDHSTFITLWSQSNHWALFVHPWKVSLTLKIVDHQPFLINVTANIQYPTAKTFESLEYTAATNATIVLPPELSVITGENVTKTLGTGQLQPGGQAETSWMVTTSTNGTYTIAVQATGRIAGNVTAHGIYPAYNYLDAIGGEGNKTIWLGYPGDVNGDGKVDIRDIVIAALAFGSYPGHPQWNPIADVTGPDDIPDGKVDIRDIAFIAMRFGTIY